MRCHRTAGGVAAVNPAARKLVQTTYDALWKGIRTVRPGARLGDVEVTVGAAACRVTAASVSQVTCLTGAASGGVVSAIVAAGRCA